MVKFRANKIMLGTLPLFLLAATTILLPGCENARVEDHGANQSLVEIGERSLEQAESLEGQGRASEANVAYRRALWAFRYHEKLIREQPFLLDEALEGIKRTGTP